MNFSLPLCLDVDGHQNEATVDLAQDDRMWDDDGDDTHAPDNQMGFSLGSTGSTMGAPPRVHPPGASGLRLEFGSMGSTKAEKLIGTGTCSPVTFAICVYGKIGPIFFKFVKNLAEAFLSYVEMSTVTID